MAYTFQGLRYSLPVSVESIDRSAVVEALNLKRRGVVRSGQYWRVSITLEPDFHESRNAFGRLSAHRSRHSRHEAFDLPMPQPPDDDNPLDSLAPQVMRAGAEAGLVRVQQALAVLHPDGLGRFVRVQGRPKVFQIIQVVEVSGQSGASDLALYPAISRGDYPTGETVRLEFHSFNIRCRYSPDGNFATQVNASGVVAEQVVVDEAV